MEAIIEAFLNLIVSLILVTALQIGLFGILLGTAISNFCINIWWELYVVFKFGFKRSSGIYFFSYIKESAVCILTTIIINSIWYNK